MIVVLKPGITKKEETAVLTEIRKLGYKPHVIRGVERTVIGAIGDERTHHTLETLSAWSQVEQVMPVQKRYKLVSREGQKSNSVVTARGVPIGGKKFQIMAGPCSVESEEQILRTAEAVKNAAGSSYALLTFLPVASRVCTSSICDDTIWSASKLARVPPESAMLMVNPCCRAGLVFGRSRSPAAIDSCNALKKRRENRAVLFQRRRGFATGR